MSYSARKYDKTYTYSDYLSWDDGESWELINGTAYNMSPAPSRKHQEISVIITTFFFNYLKDKKCKVYAAPFDVRLPEADENDADIKTVVQPDILVVCDESKLDERGMQGAPDLIVEITSPHTAHCDLKEKFYLYEKHRVKEYWIVHPYEETVLVYKPGPDHTYSRAESYAGNDEISVGIFRDLTISLDEVFGRRK